MENENKCPVAEQISEEVISEFEEPEYTINPDGSVAETCGQELETA